MLTKLLVKVLRPLGLRALARFVRDAAEGDHGEGLQKLYWKLVGWKTGIGFVLAVLAGTAALTGADPRIAQALTAVAGVLVSLGLTDKAWRTYRPEWGETTWFRLLAAMPVELAGAFTAAFTWATSQCSFGSVWCGLIEALILLLAAAAIQIGLLDAGWRAPIPQVSSRRVQELTGRPK